MKNLDNVDILAEVEESKRRTHMMHNTTIDWETARLLIPFCIKDRIEPTEEFKRKCEVLHKLFTSIEENIRNMRALIPVPPTLEINNN